MSIKKRRRKINIIKRIRVLTLSILVIFIWNKLADKIFDKEIVSEISLTSLDRQRYEEEDTVVILDPGHGGYDTGALYGELYEKDIVFNIAMMVGEILEENDIKVIYTRSSDIALGDYEKYDLLNRVKISNSYNADYFISFHINDYESYYEEVYGFEVWTNFNDEKSVDLGKNIEYNLYDLNYTQQRPMLDGSEELCVIRENNISSVLIEFGFMNSYNDREFFRYEYNQELLAEAVANAVIESASSSKTIENQNIE